MKTIAIALALCGSLAACSGKDDCARAADKIAPLMMKDMPKGGAEYGVDKLKEEAAKDCRDELKKKPETQKTLDCINALSGEPTEKQLDECEAKSKKDKDK